MGKIEYLQGGQRMIRLAKKIGAIIMIISMVLSVAAPFSLFVVSEAARGLY